ncbi:hypothetical protein [Gracilimonas halophila]|uniref:Uncharacterized protein n=1 Tax=Gracilimonas halophila TaxID=1834464 RepID=A0ABW5JJG1_9BACT
MSKDIACGDTPEHVEQNGAEKYVDAFLSSSPKESQKRDSINDFYSDLASPSTKRTLAINKNTADRHGRT